jgi:prolycopene isomerase
MKYDAVVIGSGLGGLTCGAFLARAGMRVCVLEQHTKIGGYAHSFKRRAFTFESGIHTVPMGRDGIVDHLFKLLGISESIQTIELPEMYHTVTPAFSFAMPAKRDDIVAKLKESFPHEREGIDRLLQAYQHCYDAIMLPFYSYEERFVAEDRAFASKFHNVSYEQYLNHFFKDERLKAAFYGQWPYGGGSPDFGGALFYTMMHAMHYFDGTHTVKGGFKTLADALAGVITGRGGLVKTRSRVTGVVTEGKLARCVKTEAGEEIEARIVVSNISPYQLHGQLIAEQDRSKLFRRRLSNLNPSMSAVIVYCGLKNSLRQLMPHNTTFWFSSLDNRAIFDRIQQDRHESLDHLIFLRSADEAAAPTLTLLYFLKPSASQNWKADKAAWSQRLLQQAERLYPGLREEIDLVEIGSPATFERYTSNTAGALYGFENTKSIYAEAKLPIATHLDNLFQTGHWGKPGCGVLNVMFNGYTTYHTIMQNPSLGR